MKVVEALLSQAIELWRDGKRSESVQLLREAVAADPQHVGARTNLAAALHDQGDLLQAESHIRLAIELAPHRGESWHTLGNILSAQQRWVDAARSFERSLAINPLLALGNLKAADCWLQAQQFASASRQYLASPDPQAMYDPLFLTRAGETLLRVDMPAEALARYERVAQLVPGDPAAHSNCGTALQALARHDEAIACHRRATALAPQTPVLWSNLLGSLNYSASHGPREVKTAAVDFDRHCAKTLRKAHEHKNPQDPARRLRVGYLSPDLRRHSVAYFLLPILENHSDVVEVVCYHDSPADDEWTAKLRAASTRWIECNGMDDEALASRIREDGIDILFDLAGHTKGNRLLVFARKPAPVQVNWLGYVITTGLGAMDWRLTYAATDPPEADDDYVEKSFRIAAPMWGYRPLPGMPEVAPAPCARNGFVTFGHFNRFSKVSSAALEAWAAILARVPNSRLAVGLPEGEARTTIARFFESRGVAANRIAAYGKMEHARFWAMHGEVDIALDPFPFNGGTTSYETLWLGVPLVTCNGEAGGFAPRFSSRMGTALLQAIGLPQCVARSPAEYVDIAIRLASDPARLAELRSSMRARMQSSALLDEQQSTLALEAAYRSMWQAWCGQGGG